MAPRSFAGVVSFNRIWIEKGFLGKKIQSREVKPAAAGSEEKKKKTARSGVAAGRSENQI